MKKVLLICLMLFAFLSSFSNVSMAKSNYKVWHSFLDEKTNSKFFSLEGNIVVFETNDGNWFSFREKITSIYKEPDLNHPSLGYLIGYPFDFSRFYFDVSKKTIYRGNQYYTSPNTKWGYVENMYGAWGYVDDIYYGGWQNRFTHDVLLKNMVSGEVEQILESNASSYFVRWTNDNKLLICRYSNQEKQKEILIYNPEAKTLKRLTLGTINLFLPEKDTLLFVKNEFQRKPWILTLKDGKERLVTDNKEVEKLYKQNSDYKKLELPATFDLKNAKNFEPLIRTNFEHNLKIKNIDVPVPMVFKKANKTYIPIRPLMQGINLKVNCLNPKQDNYKYKLVYGKKSLELTSKNSIIYLWRLYVTEKELNTLGIQNLKITPILEK